MQVTPDGRVVQTKQPLIIGQVGVRIYGPKEVPPSPVVAELSKLKASFSTIGDVMKTQQSTRRVPPWKKN